MNEQQTKRRLTSRDLLRFRMADDPQISPDGRQVLWVRTWMDAEENRYRAQVQLTEIETGATRALTAGEGQDTFPRWSPDGRSIAYLTSAAPRSPAGDPAQRDLHGLYQLLTDESLAWAVRRGDGALKAQLDAAIAAWQQDGRIEAVIDRWIPVRVTVH